MTISLTVVHDETGSAKLVVTKNPMFIDLAEEQLISEGYDPRLCRNDAAALAEEMAAACHPTRPTRMGLGPAET